MNYLKLMRQGLLMGVAFSFGISAFYSCKGISKIEDLLVDESGFDKIIDETQVKLYTLQNS